MIKLNGVVVVPTVFPDGASQVWKVGQPRSENVVEWDFESESELMAVLQLGRLIDSTMYHNELFVPYCPYARQDKPVSDDSCFGLHVFLDLVSLYYDKITTFDVHNPDVFDSWDCPIGYHDNILPVKEIADAADAVDATVFCFPDKGASERYPFIYGWGKKLVFQKDRDQATGEIKGVSICGGDYCDGKDVALIVDDICDGGRTFIEVSKAMTWAKEVHLYVSHGIFSKGLDVLREAGIKRIFTRNGEVR